MLDSSKSLPEDSECPNPPAVTGTSLPDPTEYPSLPAVTGTSLLDPTEGSECPSPPASTDTSLPDPIEGSGCLSPPASTGTSLPNSTEGSECLSPPVITGTSFPNPTEGSSASVCPSPLDIGILLKSKTPHSFDQSTILKQTPDPKLNYPTTFMHGCNHHFLSKWVKNIHGYITVHLRMVSIAKLVSCLLLLKLRNRH